MTGDVILVTTPRRWRRLPLVTVQWLDERPRDACGRPRSPATMPGFRKGVKPANAGRRYKATPLTDDDVLLLLAGCSRTSSTGLRNRALIALLYRSALRISEGLALEPDDLDRDRGLVTVRHGKNDKFGVSGMDDFGWTYLEPWLDRRAAKLGQPRDSGFVFCTIARPVTGGQLKAPYVRMLLKRLAREAGIAKRCNPHALRHGCAFGMAMEGVPLPVVSKQLRHSNIATTSTYLNHVAPELMLSAVAARPAPAHSQEPTE